MGHHAESPSLWNLLQRERSCEPHGKAKEWKNHQYFIRLGKLRLRTVFSLRCGEGSIIAFTKSLARELAPAIQVNSVAPGGTVTDILKLFGEGYEQEEAAKYPLKRLGKPEEIAQSVLFLASDAGDFYTGQVINPNGGSVMNG